MSRDIAARVIEWQRTHGRHRLPWQATRDPYRVWLSEIMLQQTQVSTVLAYYEPFLRRFPDVTALAAAPLDDVLSRWSGLGYYSRARNLHRCAREVVERHGGKFPNSSAALAELPGIGRSTAAAIAAFCFGERAAILDGNVKRVLTRALGFADDIGVISNERRLWAHAEALLPHEGIEAYTQGLMDLGAGVCLPRRPQCLLCPLAEVCIARSDGDPERYPVKRRRIRRGSRESALLWLESGETLWLTQRPDAGVWAGLWSLPEFGSVEALRLACVGWPGESEVMEPFDHVLTHLDWRLAPVRHRLPPRLAASALGKIEADLPPGRWVRRDEALLLGLPAPIRKLISTDLVGLS
jgi:A/G-specific adenine glycosylase